MSIGSWGKLHTNACYAHEHSTSYCHPRPASFYSDNKAGKFYSTAVGTARQGFGACLSPHHCLTAQGWTRRTSRCCPQSPDGWGPAISHTQQCPRSTPACYRSRFALCLTVHKITGLHLLRRHVQCEVNSILMTSVEGIRQDCSAASTFACTKAFLTHLYHVARVVPWVGRLIGDLPAKDAWIIAVVHVCARVLSCEDGAHVLLEGLLVHRSGLTSVFLSCWVARDAHEARKFAMTLLRVGKVQPPGYTNVDLFTKSVCRCQACTK